MSTMMNRIAVIAIPFVLTAVTIRAELRGPVDLEKGKVTIEAKESSFENFRGRRSLRLHNGTAWLDDAGFRDGVIEFELAASGEKGFHGVAFRASNHENYEHVYLRPHLSGKSDSVQYTPVYHGDAAWQICVGKGFEGAVTIEPDRWIHVRLAVSGSKARLEVDGQPVDFPALVRPVSSGAIGLTSLGKPARFADLVVEPLSPDDVAAFDAMHETPEAAPAGTVERWRVSTPFAESKIQSLNRLDPASWRDLQWAALSTSVRGIANLAMLRERSKGANTVFAAVTLRAKRAGVVTVRFGFSDRVVVFLNDRPLYRGDDTYANRDYRFLGTIGLFDELVLPLKRGDNDLRFAVSEDFGGWGVTLQVPEGHGVEVVTR